MKKGLTYYMFGALCLSALGACGPSDVPDQAAQGQAPSMSPRTMQMWSHSCALCHVDGNAGAPRIGHADEWRPRLAQGRQALLQHTIEGMNSMPPLGYCMACEREDFAAMIDFMSAPDAGVQP